MQISNDIKEFINVKFPENCNETTKQYFQVEVFGNICCDASINGDVVSHGRIECNQINGDIKECSHRLAVNKRRRRSAVQSADDQRLLPRVLILRTRYPA